MVGWLDAWMRGCMDGRMEVRRHPSRLLSPSATVVGVPVGVQVLTAPEQDVQEGFLSSPVLTMTRAPFPKTYYLRRAGVCSARRAWVFVGHAIPPIDQNTPRLAFRTTPLPLPSDSPPHGS